MNTFDENNHNRTSKGAPGAGRFATHNNTAPEIAPLDSSEVGASEVGGDDAADVRNGAGLVTEPCRRCGGSGFHQVGTCFGCDGSGTNTFTAAYVARRDAAARGRVTARNNRNADAQTARTVRFAGMSVEEIIVEIPDMVTVEDGMVEIWDDRTAGTTQLITIREYATGLQAGFC
jgi:hypothetical protein